MRDGEQASGAGRSPNHTKNDGNELEDSVEEGEELLKQVRDRKQSIAKLNMTPHEKDLLHRLSSGGEGNLNKYILPKQYNSCLCLFSFI